MKNFDNCACSGKSLGRVLRPALLVSHAAGAALPNHGYSEGKTCLKQWHETLSGYQRDVRELLRILKKALDK